MSKRSDMIRQKSLWLEIKERCGVTFAHGLKGSVLVEKKADPNREKLLKEEHAFKCKDLIRQRL